MGHLGDSVPEKDDRAKRTQFASERQGRPSSRACPERREWARGLGDATPQRSYCAKQTQSRSAPWETGTECAKQSQFPGGVRWDAIWGRRDAGVVQTNPIPALMPTRSSAFSGDQVPNKPNSARATTAVSAWWEKSYGQIYRSGTLAKQSQFRGRQDRWYKQSQFVARPVARASCP